jgi:hypothetical protein
MRPLREEEESDYCWSLPSAGKWLCYLSLNIYIYIYICDHSLPTNWNLRGEQGSDFCEWLLTLTHSQSTRTQLQIDSLQRLCVDRIYNTASNSYIIAWRHSNTTGRDERHDEIQECTLNTTITKRKHSSFHQQFDGQCRSEHVVRCTEAFKSG